MTKPQTPNEWMTKLNRARLERSEQEPLRILGFDNIYYNGKPVERDLSAKTDYMIIAKNRIHRWWLINVRRYPSDKVFCYGSLKGNFKLNVDINQSTPKEGRVTKITAPPEFDPDAPKKKGGHVVRRMPKQLKKIKEGQEARDD